MRAKEAAMIQLSIKAIRPAGRHLDPEISLRPPATMNRFSKAIKRKARKGFRGYPVGTIAHYGPDDRRATKMVVGIVLREDEEPARLERWLSDGAEIRNDLEVLRAVVECLRENEVKSVVLMERIIGCPHEEGVDYPEGESCPQCPFWANRDRWTGDVLH